MGGHKLWGHSRTVSGAGQRFQGDGIEIQAHELVKLRYGYEVGARFVHGSSDETVAHV